MLAKVGGVVAPSSPAGPPWRNLKALDRGFQEEIEQAEGGAGTFIPPNQQQFSSPQAKAAQEALAKEGGDAAPSAPSHLRSSKQKALTY